MNPAISVRHALKNCLDTIGYGDHDLSKVTCYITGSKDKFSTFVTNYCSLHNYTIVEEKITPLVPSVIHSEQDIQVIDSIQLNSN